MIELLRGDCLNLMGKVADRSIDLIATDLPYGVTDCKWDSVLPMPELWEQWRRILKPSGAVTLTATQPFATTVINSNPGWFKYDLIWEKSAPSGYVFSRYQPMRSHELVLVFAAGKTVYNPQWVQGGKPYSSVRKKIESGVYGSVNEVVCKSDGRRHPRSVLRFASQRGKHPTQKPVPLMEWIVQTYTHASDTVMDCCMGSGSTGVAAIKTGRNFVGMEMDPLHFSTAEKRIQGAACTSQK